MPTACHAARRCVCVSGNGSRLSSGQGAGAITLGLSPALSMEQVLQNLGMYDLSRLAQALGCEPLGPGAFRLLYFALGLRRLLATQYMGSTCWNLPDASQREQVM